ncbi:MAG: inorganic phosphate transporter, partial [Steroidobacteraceae bacterium]
GACMGMPHALSAISARRALLLMAPLTLIGATFASHGVEHTVGHNLLTGAGLSVDGLVIVIGIAFGLTSAFNKVRLPTSTIQILVFTVVGAGLAAGIGVHWSTIATLAAIWVAAPLLAGGAGYLLTRLLDHMPAVRVEARAVDQAAADTGRPAQEAAPRQAVGDPPAPPPPATRTAGGWLAGALIAVGALASFAMGGNDVANATGSLVGTHTFSPLVAGLVGGAGLAFGVLTWGRPLLHRVAFDIVTVDRSMATAAQLVQAAVVLAAVGFGFFTSLNQALVGAMTGTAAARGRHTVHAATLLGILRGWVIGPGAGIALAYAITRLAAAAAGVHTLLAGP